MAAIRTMKNAATASTSFGAEQAAYRGMRQRRRFLCWVKTKNLAATSIQKIVRGTFGRKIARCRLQVKHAKRNGMVCEQF